MSFSLRKFNNKRILFLIIFLTLIGRFNFICNTKFCNIPNFVTCHLFNIYHVSNVCVIHHLPSTNFIKLGSHNFKDQFSDNLIVRPNFVTFQILSHVTFLIYVMCQMYVWSILSSKNFTELGNNNFKDQFSNNLIH